MGAPSSRRVLLSRLCLSRQVSGDVSETDGSVEGQHSWTGPDSATEHTLRNRLYELAMKMSEKETSSGEDQESETQKESVSSEENSRSVQEELKKVGTAGALQGLGSAGAWPRGWVPRSFLKCHTCECGRAQEPFLISMEQGTIQKTAPCGLGNFPSL